MSLWKKRAMSRYRYTTPAYKTVSYTMNVDGGKIDLTEFVNELHDVQFDYIEEALTNSDCKDAKEIIDYIKSKL